MKSKQKVTKKKNIIFTTIALIAVALVAIIVFLNSNIPTTEDSKPQSTQQNTTPAETPETIQSDKTTSPPNTDHTTAPTYNESTGKRAAQVVVSVSSEENTVYIRGGLNSLETEGSCYAELKGPKGEYIIKETSLLPSASTTDCKTISIPVSELSKGTWTITLNYLSVSAEGRSNAASLDIQ